jgi:LPXTG-motif cell wall-anchored protein
VNPSRLTRRLTAGAAGLLIGAAGALAVASPASAHHTEVVGTPECLTETGEWLVTWTVTSQAPEEVKQFRLIEVSHEPADTELTGLPLDVDQSVDTPFTGEQRLPSDATSASLTVKAKWDNGRKRTNHGEVWFEGTCDQREEPPADDFGEWTFDCDELTITITTPLKEPVTLTFVPSEGEPVQAEFAPGEPTTVTFPASEGLTVEVLAGEEPITLDEPIEISSEEWAALECEEDEDEGEGGGLPETGAPTGLIAGGALALLAFGGGLYLVARRRRVIFTA